MAAAPTEAGQARAEPIPSQPALRLAGLELLERLHGGHAGTAMVADLSEVCPAFADMTIEWAVGIGATRTQIVETILQLTFYADGPAVRNSLVALKDLLARSHE